MRHLFIRRFPGQPTVILLVMALFIGSAVLWSVADTANSAPQSSESASESSPEPGFQPGPGLPPGISLVDQQLEPERPGEPFIAWRRYRLDNGLTVIVHQDHSDPLVHVQVDYHVGSARERPGYSGFAHFFEHMMFQGSQHVGDQQHFQIVNTAGGTLNGATDRDRTVYYQTVPANQLETVLWLEADRMGFLLPAVTEKKFEIQRDTVKNERAQRIDNQPYGRSGEVMAEAFYPPEHPYSWPVIGYPEDLDRSELEDLRQFFLRWYGPENAVLTLAGDLELTQTLAWVIRYFGAIPRGPGVERAEKEPFTLPESRYLVLEDRIVQPLVQIQWPTVWWGHPDQPALSLLASLLGQGRGSLLQSELVDTRQVLSAGSSHRCGELSCSFGLYALQAADHPVSLAEAERLLREQLAVLLAPASADAAEDPLAGRLQRARQQRRAHTVFGLQSAAGKARVLAWNQLFAGEPGFLSQDLARFDAVTADDIRRVGEQYLLGEAAVVLSVVPRNQRQRAAAEANYQPAKRRVAEREPPLPLRQVADEPDVDRTAQPLAGTNPPLTTPDFWRKTLDNGLTLVGSYYQEAPTVTFSLRLRAGGRFVPVAQAGLASLTAAMLEEGTEQLDAVALAQALEGLGSHISVSAGLYFTTLTVSCLAEQLEPTLALLKQLLFEPRFDDADFIRLKAQWLQGLEQQLLRPGAVAGQQWGWLNYGKDNPLGWPQDGTTETVSALTLDDVKRFYTDYYSPAGASLVMVGLVKQPELMQAVTFLTEWQKPARHWPQLPPRPVPDEKIYLVDRPAAVQSVLRIGRPALAWDADGDYFRNQLMNYTLGGNFNSRLNQVLREELGFTYGISSYFSGGPESGSFVISTDVRRDVTAEALAAVLEIVDEYRHQGPRPDELSRMRQAVSQQEALQYETPGQKAGYLHQLLLYDLPADYTRQQAEIVQSVSADELRQRAGEWLPQPGERWILVVGDKAEIQPGLEALGLPVVELSP